MSTVAGLATRQRLLAAADDAGSGAVDRLGALLAEPVDPIVDAERLAYRERYASLVAAELRAAIDGGEIPAQDVALTAAVLIGGGGEALVGPLSSVEGSDQVVPTIGTFVRRAIGAA